MINDLRWKQRFQNFERAFVLLRSAVEKNNESPLNQLELEGLIQRFEFCFELAWKTMKDFLQQSGLEFNPVTPRNVIKEAFSARLISDGQVWIDMMLHRNLLSHTYDFNDFNDVLIAIDEFYINTFNALYTKLLLLNKDD